MDRDSVLEERVDELRRRQEVGLIGRQDVGARIATSRIPKLAFEIAASARERTWRDRPRVAIAALDGVLAHPVDPEEQGLAIP